MFNMRNMSIAKRLTLSFRTIGTAMVISAAKALQGAKVAEHLRVKVEAFTL